MLPSRHGSPARRPRSRWAANSLCPASSIPTSIYKSESDIESFAQGEGYIQVSGEEVLVLVEEAIRPNDLDGGDLRDRARRAEEAARDAEDGSEEQRRAQRDLKRWQAFLKIAEGGAR